MKKLLCFAFAALMGAAATAQEATTWSTSATTVIKNVTTTIVENVTYEVQEAAPKKIAVFVQNRTRVAGMDDEMDGVRDRLSAALAEVDGFEVVDSAQVADSFRRYKVTVAEEKAGLIAGVFTGGSVPRIAQMLGCDYIAAATVVNASSLKRNVGGRLSTVFTLRMTLKVMDATGASVDGMPTWVRQLPILDASDADAMNYYQMLFDQWATDVTKAVAAKASRWRKPAAAPVALAAFTVTTTIDETVAELESQTRGAQGEQLLELRRVVGGATIELDGAVIGSAPGSFRATPGLHQLRVTREWMKPYTATVNVYDGLALKIALEMSDEGVAKWGGVEALRADLALRYAAAARERGVKVNVNLDSSGWRDVGTGAAGSVINNVVR